MPSLVVFLTTEGHLNVRKDLEWSKLPYHILVHICSYLNLCERARFGTVCRAFNESLNCRLLWKRFRFSLHCSTDGWMQNVILMYGHHMQHVIIELVQMDAGNRENAVHVLRGLARIKKRRLKKLVVRFLGESPCFYNGYELLSALGEILGKPKPEQEAMCPLVDLNLGGMYVSLDTAFVDLVSENNPLLEKLNILNKALVCNIIPGAIVRLAQRCQQLTELQLLCASLNDEVLLAFASPDRIPLKYLSIMFRGRGNYAKTVTSETWSTLVQKLPNLRVSLLFDHTCPTDRVAEVMCPQIPVCRLVMETYTYIYEEVNLASQNYRYTLTEFVLHTPLSRNAPELNRALIKLATICTQLTEMHVYCLLDLPTIDAILALRPKMKEDKKYTLRYERWPVSETKVVNKSDVF